MLITQKTNFFNLKDKKHMGERAVSLVQMNAVDKVNKLETVPFNITDESINKILMNSEFESVRERLGYILSVEGQAIVLTLPYKNTYLVEVLRVSDYTRVGRFNTMLEGYSGKQVQHNGVEYQLYTRLSFVNNVPTLSRFIKDVDEQGEELEVEWGVDFTFETEELPGELFFNNQAKVSDIEYAGVLGALERLDYHDSKLQAEWERTRTTPVYNTNFTDVDPSSDAAAVDNGRGFDTEDSMNSKYGIGKQMLPATLGTTILQSQIVFLEDDIKVKLGMARDTINSGSNQHNLEMVMSNQFGTETLMKQRMLREKMWNSYFEKLSKVLGTTAPVITVEFSAVEKAKLDLLEASVSEAKMKSQNVASQNVAQEGE